MDTIIEGIQEVLIEGGDDDIAKLLEEAEHEIIESGTYGSRLFSTLSTLVVKTIPTKTAALNRLSESQKKKIMDAALMFYPIQDNFPEIHEIIFKAIAKKNKEIKSKKVGSQSTLSSGKTYCVIATVENYNENHDFPKVNYATKDGDDFVKSLKNLGYDTTGFVILKNSKTTKSSIIQKLKYFAEIATSNDRIIFYFAGHGFFEGGENLLAPVDAAKVDKAETCVSINKLLGLLKKSECHQNILFIDCCHSGFAAGDENRDGEDSFSTDRLIYDYAKEEFCIGFASCKSNQKSVSFPILQNGVWSHFLNKALRGEAEGFYNENLLFSDQLQSYLKANTTEYVKMNSETKRDQTPIQFGSLTDRFIIADLTPVFEIKKKDEVGSEVSVTNISLLSEANDSVKKLPGFKKGYYSVPTSIGSTSGKFIKEIGKEIIEKEIEELSKKIREILEYKRAQVKASSYNGSGSITTPDFDYNISMEQDNEVASDYVLIRKLENFRNSDIVELPKFNEIFSRHFDKLELQLSQRVDITKLIDKIEDLPKSSGIKVKYSSTDMSYCTIIIDGFGTEIYATTNTLSISTGYLTSPNTLIDMFKETRKLIASTPSLQTLQ